MQNKEAIDRLRLDIEMAQFDPITGNRRYLFGDEKELVEAQRLGMEALMAQKVRHWITLQDEYGDIVEAVCSCCNQNGNHEWAFCPHCGARMEGQE